MLHRLHQPNRLSIKEEESKRPEDVKGLRLFSRSLKSVFR